LYFFMGFLPEGLSPQENRHSRASQLKNGRLLAANGISGLPC
jgi:hypothetical protein